MEPTRLSQATLKGQEADRNPRDTSVKPMVPTALCVGEAQDGITSRVQFAESLLQDHTSDYRGTVQGQGHSFNKLHSS